MSCMILYKNDAVGVICLALAQHLMKTVINHVNDQYEGTLSNYAFEYAPLQAASSWAEASEHLDLSQYKAPSMSLPEGLDIDRFDAFVVLATNLEAISVERLSKAAKINHDVSIIGVERPLAAGAFDNVLYVTPESLVDCEYHTPSLYHTTFDLLAGLYNAFIKERCPSPLLSVSVGRILADENLMKMLDTIDHETVTAAGQYIIDHYSVADKLEKV